MSFYVELSSNAVYQYNTIGNFRNTVQLLHPLEGNWEVGMSEIFYTKSWKNVAKNCVITVEKMFENSRPVNSYASAYGYIPLDDGDRKGILRSGYYESIEELCQEIEKEMLPFSDNCKYLPKFIIDKVTQMVYIKPGMNKDNRLLLPRLNRELAEILGFDFYSIKAPKHNVSMLVLPDRPADISAGISTLFVYCNLVVPQYIGDTRAKLLKTVEVPSIKKFGDSVSIPYPSPHYVPVLTNDFESIEIDIKDDTNTPVHFMFGRTRVKLHFRKCQTHT